MAAQSLLEAREGGEDHPRVALVAAELAMTTEQVDRALAILRAALDRYPAEVPLMLRYGEILLTAGLPDEAEMLLKRMQEQKVSRIRMGQIEAGLLKARGDWRGAIDILAWIVEKRSNRLDAREAYLATLTEAAENELIDREEADAAARAAQEDFPDDRQIELAAARLLAVFDDEAAARARELEEEANRRMAESAARLAADPPRAAARRKPANGDDFSLRRRPREPVTED